MRRLLLFATALFSLLCLSSTAWGGCLGGRSARIEVDIPKTWVGDVYGYHSAAGCCVTFSAKTSGCWTEPLVYHWYSSLTGMYGTEKSFWVCYSPGVDHAGTDHIHLRVREDQEPPDGGVSANQYIHVHDGKEYYVTSERTEWGAEQPTGASSVSNCTPDPISATVTTTERTCSTDSVSCSCEIGCEPIKVKFGVDTSEEHCSEAGTSVTVEVPPGKRAVVWWRPQLRVREGKVIRFKCDGTHDTECTFTITEFVTGDLVATLEDVECP